ncbi:MAG: hypothetical protein ACI9U2_005084 [Bradymonadia bacterium]|jgi:hypothetical protein
MKRLLQGARLPSREDGEKLCLEGVSGRLLGFGVADQDVCALAGHRMPVAATSLDRDH